MNPTSIHMMVDLETLGPAPDGAIVSIGWCAFRMTGLVDYAPDGYYGRILVDVNDCVDKGMVIDPDTVAWWSRQSDEVRAMLRDQPRLPLLQALVELGGLYKKLCEEPDHEDTGIMWAYPANFDLAILDRAQMLCKYRMGVSRTKYGCARSVMKFLSYDRSKAPVPQCWVDAKHMPEADAVRQALQLIDCYGKLLD